MVVQRVVKCKHRVIVFARYFWKYTSKLSSQLPSKIFSYNTAHSNNLTIIQLEYTASLHAVSSILRIPSLRLKGSRIDKVCYSAPGMQGGSGVLSRMCLSVFVFVHKHIPEQTTRPILTKFFYACHPWPWLGSPLVAAWRYVMYFRFYGWRHTCT